MTTLMSGLPVGESGSGDAVLEMVGNRYRELQQLLDDISPFYRYRITLIAAAELAGVLDGPPPSEGECSGVAAYRRVSPDYFVGLTITPISEEAAVYDPISVRVQLSAEGETEAAELGRFFEYGIAPEQPVSAVVVEATGPPGSIPPLAQPGLIHLADAVVPSPWESLALYAFVDDPGGGEDVVSVELGPLVTTEGQSGRAMRAEGQAIGIQLSVRPTGGTMSLSSWPLPIAGKLPHRVLPELIFAQLFWSGTRKATLGVPCGPALVNAVEPPARPDDVESAEFWADMAGALRILQRFTVHQLRMPHRLSSKEAHTIRSAAELVLTGTSEIDWENLRIVRPAMPLDAPVAIMAFWPLRLTYDDQTVELDVTIRQECDMVEAIEATSDYLVVRPVDGAKLRQSLVRRSERDYRVLARPLVSSPVGGPGGSVLGGQDAASGPGRDELALLTVPALRTMARDARITGYSKLRKHELVDALVMSHHGASGAIPTG